MLKRFIAGVAVALGLFGLTACETISVSPEQLQLINGGSQSGIIMSYKEHEGLWGSTINIANVATGQIYSLSMHGGDNWVNAGPDMVMAPPGRYRVLSGSIYASDTTGTMPLLRWWFKDFDVGAGEVVDVGTLKMTDIDVRSISSDQLVRFFSALVTLGDERETSTYVMYDVDYSDDVRVQAMLKSKYPTLSVKPVKRPLQVALDRKEFERIIVEAYSPGADRKSPSSSEAEAKVNVLVKEFVERSLAPQTPAS
ncbi:MAG: hypothetical protein ABMA14_25780 [Hyphomonadaceae bacterium]